MAQGKKQSTTPYTTFLLSPPIPAFDLKTPISVSNYAKFMQSSWWETEFARYGHAAFKTMMSSPSESQPRPTLSILSSSYKNFFSLLSMYTTRRFQACLAGRVALPQRLQI